MGIKNWLSGGGVYLQSRMINGKWRENWGPRCGTVRRWGTMNRGTFYQNSSRNAGWCEEFVFCKPIGTWDIAIPAVVIPGMEHVPGHNFEGGIVAPKPQRTDIDQEKIVWSGVGLTNKNYVLPCFAMFCHPILGWDFFFTLGFLPSWQSSMGWNHEAFHQVLAPGATGAEALLAGAPAQDRSHGSQNAGADWGSLQMESEGIILKRSHGNLGIMLNINVILVTSVC